MAIPALYGAVERLGTRPESESGGVRSASLEELPGVYYRWDPLLEAVFAWAERQYLNLQCNSSGLREFYWRELVSPPS